MIPEDRYGKIIGPGKIRFQRILPGPIEKIWAYLTESEMRGKWLAKGDMELFEGGKVNLHFLHKELSPLKESPPEKYKGMELGHSFTGKILRINPPHLLAFTWEGHSEVTFELEEIGSKVILILTHTKLAQNFITQSSVAGGWHTHLDILEASSREDIPPGFWTKHAKLEEEYTRILSATNE